MMQPNPYYKDLKEEYLFRYIAGKTEKFRKEHPGKKLLRMGIGDVTLPLPPSVIRALHEAVSDQADPRKFQGYMPECGADFLRNAVAAHYRRRGIDIDPAEVFVSSGASDELGDLQDLFARENTALIMEPVYPAYLDACIIAGRKILHLPSGWQNNFLPEPDDSINADMVYLCSPNNPTGAVFTKALLQDWVDWANRRGAVILFDAAYEAFITDENLPKSIFEINGARTCAIEICSLSKTVGFTGTRLGYTVIPEALVRQGMSLNRMWIRNRTTKTNGISYILQKGGSAVFTEEGQKEIQENITVYRKNAAVLSKALEEEGVCFTGGKNAPYIWMKCPNSLKSWDFFDLLLQKIQVVGTPGAGFGEAGEGCLRFSMFGSPADTEEAACRLGQLLRRIKEGTVSPGG